MSTEQTCVAEQEPHRQHVCVHVLKTARARRCVCESPRLQRPRTQRKRTTWPETSEEVVARGTARGLPPPPGRKLGEWERCRTWGRELGVPDGRGGGRGSRSSGGGWVEQCAVTTEEAPGGCSLWSWSALLFLTREPLPGRLCTCTWAWACWCSHTCPHGSHTYTCSLLLCRVDARLCSRPGHHCLSLTWACCDWSRSHG